MTYQTVHCFPTFQRLQLLCPISPAPDCVDRGRRVQWRECGRLCLRTLHEARPTRPALPSHPQLYNMTKLLFVTQPDCLNLPFFGSLSSAHFCGRTRCLHSLFPSRVRFFEACQACAHHLNGHPQRCSVGQSGRQQAVIKWQLSIFLKTGRGLTDIYFFGSHSIFV